MNGLQFRPELTSLEDRVVPATFGMSPGKHLEIYVQHSDWNDTLQSNYVAVNVDYRNYGSQKLGQIRVNGQPTGYFIDKINKLTVHGTNAKDHITVVGVHSHSKANWKNLEGKITIKGYANDDVLIGSKDLSTVFVGGGGKDIFRGGNGKSDKIVDWQPGVDKLKDGIEIVALL